MDLYEQQELLGEEGFPAEPAIDRGFPAMAVHFEDHLLSRTLRRVLRPPCSAHDAQRVLDDPVNHQRGQHKPHAAHNAPEVRKRAYNCGLIPERTWQIRSISSTAKGFES